VCTFIDIVIYKEDIEILLTFLKPINGSSFPVDYAVSHGYKMKMEGKIKRTAKKLNCKISTEDI